MTEAPTDASGAAHWTCPFCALLCDGLGVGTGADGSFALTSGRCAAAGPALATFRPDLASVGPAIDGVPCSDADAVARAAAILGASRQPLFGGLGTDVDGSRAIYRLAAATGAICDPAGGNAATEALRALQDRGGYTTTLAEIRDRADVIVWFGPTDSPSAADLFDRCAALAPDDGGGTATARHIVAIGDDTAAVALGATTGVTVEKVALHGDAMTTAAILAALVAGRPVPDPPPALAALAARLVAARYAVFAAETAQLPAHGGLFIETCNRIVATLNLTTRAAALWLGTGHGGGTANQVFAWLSGLPLRSRAGPHGLEHEPLAFDTARLVASGSVDALVWVSSFDAGCTPPETDLPLVVLGHPALAGSAARANAVFIPVATPGIDCAGHLFRADGNTVLPLRALRAGTLPLLADVLGRIGAACAAGGGGRSAR